MAWAWRPGANIGTEAAVFEPVHGSAPKYAGLDRANPTAMILSGALMLRHLGYPEQAGRLEAAVREVIAEGRSTTYDLGGSTGTPGLRRRHHRAPRRDARGTGRPMTELPASLRLPRKPAGTAALGLGKTRRLDRWWVAPGVQATVFTICATYLFVSGILLTPMFGTPYEHEGYLSPLFSPLIRPDWLPTWFSPGIFILWVPLGFRATCYYYRKAYYRFYFADPPGCAVGEPPVHRRYRMEAALPFILQNFHRFFLYLAFIPLFFLWVDAVSSLRVGDQWRIGLGVFVLGFNAAAADRLLAVLSLPAPPHRRAAGLFLVHPPDQGALLPVAAADRAQPPSHGLGLGEPAHRHVRGHLRPAAGPRRDHRPGHLLLADR